MTLGSVLGGLLLMAWSQVSSLWSFYLLFAGVGLAQAMTMYEPAFAVITRRYGAEARRGITAVTLWGGFASTVFIPLTQLLLDATGWRNALLVLGACNLALCVPLHAAVISPRLDAPAAPARGAAPMSTIQALRWVVKRPAFWGLLVAFTVYYGMFVGLTFHLYPMLQERGFAIATIIGALAIIGPAQVGGRIAMWVLAREKSVRVIGLATVAGFPVCLLLLILLPRTFATLAAFAFVYGAVNGVTTIVRGLVVPELLTRDAYGAINGLLALPANIAKAFAPAATAALWAVQGSYDLVLWAALVSSIVVVLAFAFASASAKREPAA
jgi:predicted MFS family arabinose efflux permease